MAQLSDRMRELVQPHLRDLEPYDPNFTPTRVNLSANENTYGVPATVRAAMDEALAATPTNRYPDPMSNELRDALAAWHGVRRVCEACPGLVLVDEAYGEFAEEGASAEALLAECDNLLVLHTLSKAFALAGARCGYVVAAPDVVDALAAVRQIYSVNVLTQAAALVAVERREEFSPVVAQIRAERTRLFEALSRIEGVRAWPSEGNFVLVRTARASRVRERLRDEYSILVRDFSYAPGLADCLRVTVGTPEENGVVIDALAALVADGAAAEEGGAND